MALSVKPKPYLIPEYSLTGDLLAFLTCGLQYRYHNKGALPPSTPVQLWFGEFIHGVLEEAYLQWKNRPQLRRFPWIWISDIRDIELQIDKRLKARGLYPPPRLFCPYGSITTSQGLCPDTNHPHKLIASERTEAAINTWGQHLFPLISEAEVRLKGSRPMPNYRHGISRCNYYGITGVIDVISSVNLLKAPSGNLIVHNIHRHQEIQQIINNLSSLDYEIIIDYKGMRRPSFSSGLWHHHEWQVLTYAWLRSQQSHSLPIVAGIIFYINELAPSQEDMEQLVVDVNNHQTDIMPSRIDLQNIQNWKHGTSLPVLTQSLKEERSIRIIPVTDFSIQKSLQQFDNVVSNIESAVLSEIGGSSIVHSWPTNPKQRNCTACDFKTFCPNPAPRRYTPTVP